jgi:hypothetical protein
VINVENLKAPQLLKTYQMTNPHGLGIDNTTLFIDVIPYNNTLIMIGEDGLFQYDYSNPKDIKLLSTLEIHDEN